MAFDLAAPLVIGISSRALFDLEEENRLFEEKGLAAYEEYQLQHENDLLQPGSAFQLVKSFLELNGISDNHHLVEVIIMSRNSPNTSLRIFNSIKEYGLDISRAALTSGAEMTPYLNAFQTDLFLSANENDVKGAINKGIAAGMILPGTPTTASGESHQQIRIAFDGDAVLFGSASERIYQQHGMEAFMENEATNADVPMQEGPFVNFLKTIAHIQALFRDQGQSPIRTALVTSRNAPAHERAIKTLRKWGVHVDEAFFLGGVEKKDILAAFGAHIFFDDQRTHTDPASRLVPSAVVPYRDGDDPRQ